MNIKDLFDKAENGVLTWEQFENAAKEAGAKFADLSGGLYVSKSKYDADLKTRDTEINSLNTRVGELNSTITTRDGDLEKLRTQLNSVGDDAAKLAEANNALTALQTKYDKATKDYQARMQQQAYEFAVKDFANTKKFSSQAAKRDFTQAMIAKKLQMENGILIGGDDFVTLYSQDNADAFMVETPEPEPTPAPSEPIPTIVAPTPGAAPTNDGGFQFNFTGVRAHN